MRSLDFSRIAHTHTHTHPAIFSRCDATSSRDNKLRVFFVNAMNLQISQNFQNSSKFRTLRVFTGLPVLIFFTRAAHRKRTASPIAFTVWGKSINIRFLEGVSLAHTLTSIHVPKIPSVVGHITTRTTTPRAISCCGARGATAAAAAPQVNTHMLPRFPRIGSLCARLGGLRGAVNRNDDIQLAS